jgi:hypothetical protein
MAARYVGLRVNSSKPPGTVVPELLAGKPPFWIGLDMDMLDVGKTVVELEACTILRRERGKGKRNGKRKRA